MREKSGLGTCLTSGKTRRCGCRGIKGPFPPPLSIRVYVGEIFSQVFFEVKANEPRCEVRLDYFGQNIKIAARVQSLAQVGEIWLTEPVYRAHHV